jgi:uncharacterized membrane protein
MKRLGFFFIGLILFFISPHQALADNNWVIENFNSYISIQQSGVVSVIETISVNFRDQTEHGIYRDIPYIYNQNGKQIYTSVNVTKVLRNNSPSKYTTSLINGNEEVKIGDPNNLITGRNVYTIHYTVTGVLRTISDNDEFYWNATGNDWAVPIQKAEATVLLPKEGITRVTCYEGPVGSQANCQSSFDSTAATFATTSILAASEGLTAVVDYKKGLVPILIAKPPLTFWEKLIQWPSNSPFVSLVLAGILTLGILWYKYGRDYWFAGNLFGTKDQKGKAKPIGAHETISVEFTPPEKLRPAEIGVLMDERADTLDVVATIIDLATRGYLTITEVPRKWMFGKVDYLLTMTKPKVSRKESGLLHYEQLLLDKLFYKRRQVKLSILKTTFYSELKEVKQALYNDVVSKGFFQISPEKVRRRYFLIAIILFVGGLSWTVFGFTNNISFFGSSGLGFAVDGVAWLFISQFMPRKTAYGRECLRRSKGYYLFINKAERYRQRYFEKENMFNDVLPYAIVFGLTKKFAKQMEKMGVKPTQTDWYVGSGPFTTGLFVGSISDFSNSMSSAMASVPSSSGGFSGGSSGGGFGGGGGGSW